MARPARCKEPSSHCRTHILTFPAGQTVVLPKSVTPSRVVENLNGKPFGRAGILKKPYLTA